jgi:hypothetical protein
VLHKVQDAVSDDNAEVDVIGPCQRSFRAVEEGSNHGNAASSSCEARAGSACESDQAQALAAANDTGSRAAQVQQRSAEVGAASCRRPEAAHAQPPLQPEAEQRAEPSQSNQDRSEPVEAAEQAAGPAPECKAEMPALTSPQRIELMSPTSSSKGGLSHKTLFFGQRRLLVLLTG